MAVAVRRAGGDDAAAGRLRPAGAGTHDAVIVDPATGKVCDDGEVGEILIQGPSVAQGYWNRAEETEQVFGASVAGREGRFLRTGDLGFFRDGELFVTGRVKDVIIIRGRNHYPQDIEQSAEEAHPAVLAGRRVRARQMKRASGWWSCISSTGSSAGPIIHQIIQAIRRAIVEQHELDPYAIVLIRQTSLPITSSGKVQRNLCREQYLAGELKVVHSWTNPATQWRGGRQWAVRAAPWRRRILVRSKREPSELRNGAARRRRRPVGSVELDRAAERIEAWMLEWLVTRLALDAADVSRDRPFAEFGVDSLTAVELSHELESSFSAAAADRGLELSDARRAGPLPGGTDARREARDADEINHLADAAGNGSANGAIATNGAKDAELAALLAEVENLSDAEAARLLAEEQQAK